MHAPPQQPADTAADTAAGAALAGPVPAAPDRSPAGKWRLMAALWALQALGMVVLGALWEMLSPGLQPTPGARVVGEFTGERLGRLLGYREFWVSCAVAVGAVTLGQALLLAPVRRPEGRSARGWPLRASVAAAGFAIAALSVAALLALGSLETIAGFRFPWSEWLNAQSYVPLGLWIGAVWLGSGVLLWRFTRRRLGAGERREDVLARIAARLFLGTVVEVAAIIPLDVMARRRSDCYCFAGTYFALIVCGCVGLMALGPAVLLTVLSRRRRRWYGGHCDACGYDLAGLLGGHRPLERCPECGAGWRGPAEPAAAGR